MDPPRKQPSAVDGQAPAAGEPADEALMLAYAQGDVAAFETLYRRHRAPLFRYLKRMCGREAVAEELFQECWNRVIGMRARYEARARFTTLLYQIGERLAIDHARREYVKREVAVEDPILLSFAGEDDPETYSSDEQAAARLRAALDDLPPEQRSALLLHVDGELSLEAIAAAVGLGRETVKSRVRYALNKLRGALRR